MSNTKYDIARLHNDCLAWCENPQLKPWMMEVRLRITRYEGGRIEINNGIRYQVCISVPPDDLQVLEFAHFIGLDVESYRLPEIDRDQAVRDYLAGIEEGAPLWEGSEWVKKASGVNTIAFETPDSYFTICTGMYVACFAYTFLRLDLREDKQ